MIRRAGLVWITVTAGLVFLAIAAPGSGTGTVFLVADVDTSGEPRCIFPPTGQCVALYGGLPHQLVSSGNRLVFSADDRTHGAEPWIGDGTAAGTRLLADLCPGPCSSFPVLLGRLDGAGVLFAAEGGDGAATCRLWRADVAAAPAVVEPVSDTPFSGLCVEQQAALRAAGMGAPLTAPTARFLGELFFSHRFDPDTWGLSRSDGTAAGTERVITLCGEDPVPICTVRVQEMAVAGEALFYVTGTPGSSRPAPRLWRLDDPAGLPEEIARSCGSGDEAFTNLTAFGDGLVFVGSCVLGTDAPREGRHLFRVDGQGSVEVLRTFPTAPGAATPAGPYALTPSDDALHFTAWDGRESTLWTSDGLPAGTVRQFPEVGFPEPRSLHMAGDRFLLAERAERFDTEPLALHAVTPAGEVVLLGEFSYPSPPAIGLPLGSFRQVGEQTYFTASTARRGEELWVTDGTPEGTRRLSDIAGGPESSRPRELTIVGDTLLFAAEEGGIGDPSSPPTGIGRELWGVPLAGAVEPSPPWGSWLTPTGLDGFRLQVRITARERFEGRLEVPCQPDTACVSGALAGRPEVFVRILGPRPNGFLWPTVVRFTPSRVEVWIEQEATGEVRYYDLPAVLPGEPELSGHQDRRGFLP